MKDINGQKLINLAQTIIDNGSDTSPATPKPDGGGGNKQKANITQAPWQVRALISYHRWIHGPYL
jgi:hypothetical protein